MHGLFNTDLFHRDELYTNISIEIFCDVYQKVFSGNSVRSGMLEMGFSTPALRLLTVLCLTGIFVQ
jgi:hypothetical protein